MAFMTYCCICDKNTPHSNGQCMECKIRKYEEDLKRHLGEKKQLSLEERLEEIEKELFKINQKTAKTINPNILFGKILENN